MRLVPRSWTPHQVSRIHHHRGTGFPNRLDDCCSPGQTAQWILRSTAGARSHRGRSRSRPAARCWASTTQELGVAGEPESQAINRLKSSITGTPRPQCAPAEPPSLHHAWPCARTHGRGPHHLVDAVVDQVHRGLTLNRRVEAVHAVPFESLCAGPWPRGSRPVCRPRNP